MMTQRVILLSEAGQRAPMEFQKCCGAALIAAAAEAGLLDAAAYASAEAEMRERLRRRAAEEGGA